MPGIGIGVSPLLKRGGGTDWSSYWATQGTTELIAYTAGLTTDISAAEKERLTTFVKAVKTGLSIANLSDAFDCMYILGGETEEISLRNLVKNAHHCTAHNSPVFESHQGFIGNIAGQAYLNTHYNPSTDTVKYTLNNASFGVYSRTQRDAALKIHGVTIGANSINLYIRRTSTACRVIINSAGYATAAHPASSLGMSTIIRSDANTVGFIRDKGAIVTGAAASNALPNGNIYLLARNNAGTADAFDDVQLSFAFIGRNLSQEESDALYDAYV